MLTAEITVNLYHSMALLFIGTTRCGCAVTFKQIAVKKRSKFLCKRLVLENEF